jgi:Zn ribbon nucleic-acid-binding protein
MNAPILIQIQASPPICPQCKKTMKLMLSKDSGGRKLRCVDCGQPDPVHGAETRRWMTGELRERK